MLFGVSAWGTQTDAQGLIERSAQVSTLDWEAAPDYECVERDWEANGATKTFEDLMIMGSPYQRLIAVNDKPLSHLQQQDQQRQLERTIEQRRNESPDQRAQRIATYRKSRDRDHLMLAQLVKAFDFTLVGQQKLGKYDVYVLRAVPRRDYQPPNKEAEVLKGMRGTLWIDKKTYQWVKVEARVTRSVWIEGFVAEVEPGTRFELEKMPVDDHIWLPRHYQMTARARVLFLFRHRSQDNETYYDYRRISPDREDFTSK